MPRPADRDSVACDAGRGRGPARPAAAFTGQFQISASLSTRGDSGARRRSLRLTSPCWPRAGRGSGDLKGDSELGSLSLTASHGED
jgi:hypothetical protein